MRFDVDLICPFCSEDHAEQKAQGIKCYKCAELDGCYKGQHGGKKKCKCFSPKED